VPHYDVVITEPSGLDAIEPGQPYGDLMQAGWSGNADSPESAIKNAKADWLRKYEDDPPTDAEIKVELGPNVCPLCEGRKWVRRMVPGGTIDPGDDSPLGSAAKRTCPKCLGSGNINQRR
jgi:hypothetical protein